MSIHITKTYRRNFMLRSFLLSGLVVVGAINAEGVNRIDQMTDAEIEQATLCMRARSYQADGSNKAVRVQFNARGCTVRDDSGEHEVQKADLDESFRGRSVKDMARYAMQAGVKVKQYSDGKYAVQQAAGLKGGGPILAACAWASTQVLGWTLSLPWLFVPGGQPVFLWGTANTNILATYAASAAAVTPSI